MLQFPRWDAFLMACSRFFYAFCKAHAFELCKLFIVRDFRFKITNPLSQISWCFCVVCVHRQQFRPYQYGRPPSSTVAYSMKRCLFFSVFCSNFHALLVAMCCCCAAFCQLMPPLWVSSNSSIFFSSDISISFLPPPAISSVPCLCTSPA